MLEGNEIEGNIGSVGSYKLDVTDKGLVEIAVGMHVDVIAVLEKLAAKSGTKLDDSVVEVLKKLLGRE